MKSKDSKENEKSDNKRPARRSFFFRTRNEISIPRPLKKISAFYFLIDSVRA
jgi:hypothetical protein